MCLAVCLSMSSLACCKVVEQFDEDGLLQHVSGAGLCLTDSPAVPQQVHVFIRATSLTCWVVSLLVPLLHCMLSMKSVKLLTVLRNFLCRGL